MRVVALSVEPSLSAALNMMGDWEVVFASEAEQASQYAHGAAIVLVGGGTEEGLMTMESLRSKGVTIPGLVVGDVEPSESARYPVLRTPFTLDELRASVEQAVRDAGAKAVLRPTSAPPKEEQPPPPPAQEEKPVEESKRDAPVVPIEAPRAVPPLRVVSAPPTGSAQPKPEHQEVHPPSERKLAPAPEPEPEPEQEQEQEQEPPVPVVEDEPEIEEPAAEPPAAQQSEPEVDHPVWAEPPAATAPAIPGDAVVSGTGAYEPIREARRSLLRRRPKPPEAPAAQTENAMVGRLRSAAAALDQLEAAIREVPILADLHELSQVLVTEVVELLNPKVAAVYLPVPEGYRAWAAHGFSSVERKMVVQPHQPLFADLSDSKQGMLIEPLDLAQTLVSGIGGARTNAFLAAPIVANARIVGVIVAGGDHFEDKELEKLEGLAAEAAFGLAVSLGLERLRTGF